MTDPSIEPPTQLVKQLKEKTKELASVKAELNNCQLELDKIHKLNVKLERDLVESKHTTLSATDVSEDTGVWTYQLCFKPGCLLNSETLDVEAVASPMTTEVGRLIPEWYKDKSDAVIVKIQKSLYNADITSIDEVKDMTAVYKDNITGLKEVVSLTNPEIFRLMRKAASPTQRAHYAPKEFMIDGEVVKFGGGVGLFAAFLEQVLLYLRMHHPEATEELLCKAAIRERIISEEIDHNLFKLLAHNVTDRAQQLITCVNGCKNRGLRALLVLTKEFGRLTLITRVGSDSQMTAIEYSEGDGLSTFTQQLFRQAKLMEALNITPWEKAAVRMLDALPPDVDSAVRLQIQGIDYTQSSEAVWEQLYEVLNKSSLAKSETTASTAYTSRSGSSGNSGSGVSNSVSSVSGVSSDISGGSNGGKKKKNVKSKLKKVKVKVCLDTMAKDHVGPLNTPNMKRTLLPNPITLSGVNGTTSDLTHSATVAMKFGGTKSFELGSMLLGKSVKQHLWSVAKGFSSGVITDFHLKKGGNHTMCIKGEGGAEQTIELEITDSGVYAEIELESMTKVRGESPPPPHRLTDSPSRPVKKRSGSVKFNKSVNKSEGGRISSSTTFSFMHTTSCSNTSAQKNAITSYMHYTTGPSPQQKVARKTADNVITSYMHTTTATAPRQPNNSDATTGKEVQLNTEKKQSMMSTETMDKEPVTKEGESKEVVSKEIEVIGQSTTVNDSTEKARKKKKKKIKRLGKKYNVGDLLYDTEQRRKGYCTHVTRIDKKTLIYTIVDMGPVTSDGGGVQTNESGGVPTSDEGGIYTWKQSQDKLTKDTESVDKTVPPAFLQHLHELYGHLNNRTILKLFKIKCRVIDNFCQACIRSKMTRRGVKKKYRNGMSRTSYKLQLVHTDIIGPIRQRGIHGSRYIITFLDDYTRRANTYILKKKSDAVEALTRYISEVGTPVAIHADCGGEFKSTKFLSLARNMKIRMNFGTPYAHALNGMAERFNRTLCEKAFAMMLGKEVPDFLWPTAIKAATYIYNRQCHRGIGDEIPEEKWRGVKVDTSNLVIYGTVTYILKNPDMKTPHFTDKTRAGIVVGFGDYDNEHSFGTYDVFMMDTKKIVRTRNVMFAEAYSYTDIMTPGKKRQEASLQPTRRHFWHNDPRWDIHSSFLNDENIRGHRSDNSRKAIPMITVTDETATHTPTASRQPCTDHSGSDKCVEESKEIDTNENDTETIATDTNTGSGVMDTTGADLASYHSVKDRVRKAPARFINEAVEIYGQPQLASSSLQPVIEEEGDDVAEPRIVILEDDETETIQGAAAEDSSPDNTADTVEVMIAQTVESPYPTYSYSPPSMPIALRTEIHRFRFTPLTKEILEFKEQVKRDFRLEKEHGIPIVPKNSRIALEHPIWGSKWKAAIQLELHQLYDKRTFDIKPVSRKRRKQAGGAIKTKWVLTVKRTRFKARLVVLGFLQRNKKSRDNFSPVACRDTTRILFSYAVARGFNIRQWDVSNAFLYAMCLELVLIMRPEHFELLPYIPLDAEEIRLNKMLYGMVDSPQRWNEELDEILQDFSLTRSTTDPGHYYNNFTGLHLVVHVDDGIYAGPDKEMEKFEKYLIANCGLEIEPEPADIFCGVTIEQGDGYISVHQRPYIEQLVMEFITNGEEVPANNELFKVPKIPMEKDLRLWKREAITIDIIDDTNVDANAVRDQLEKDTVEGDDIEDLPYRELIGKLLWVACSTRPDISNSVRELTKMNKCFTKSHYKYAIRVLRYLYGTRDRGLLFQKGNETATGVCHKQWSTKVYSDASHDSGPSTGGFVTILRGTPIAWSSKTQRKSSPSSAESEFKQMSVSVSHAVKIQETLHNFGMLQYSQPIPLFADNKPALRNMSRPAGSSVKTQHVDKSFYFVQCYVCTDEDVKAKKGKSKEVVLKYISTQKQLADIMTKNLGGPKHSYFRDLLVQLIPSSCI